jgi:hypothetical protein
METAEASSTSTGQTRVGGGIPPGDNARFPSWLDLVLWLLGSDPRGFPIPLPLLNAALRLERSMVGTSTLHSPEARAEKLDAALPEGWSGAWR